MNPPEHLIDIEAEQAVLGACLIDPDALSKICDDLTAADFHDGGHKLIFGAMRDLLTEGVQADYLVLSRKLHENLAKVGSGDTRGQAYLTSLITATPTSMHVTRYAKIVHRLSTLRRLMDAAGQIAKLAYGANGDALDDVFSRARRLVDAIAPAHGDDALLMWLESLDAFYQCQLERMEERSAEELNDLPRRALFAWAAIRNYVSYVREGMLVTVAAESSVGKTAFFETQAEYLARLGFRTVFFHAELSHQVMLDRRMCRLSGVPIREIENGKITEAMEETTQRMQGWPGGIHYVHCPGWTAQRIVNQARLLVDKGECDFVIVDYFQKLKRQYIHGMNTAQAAGAQAETLKIGSEQLETPFIVGSQFNRRSFDRGMKTGADIRDTGELAEKSNIVITLDRELLQADFRDSSGSVIVPAGQRSPVCQGRIDKNTNGPTGGFQLNFYGPRFLFTDMPQGGQREDIL
jgi:replicative DNA helicase